MVRYIKYLFNAVSVIGVVFLMWSTFYINDIISKRPASPIHEYAFAYKARGGEIVYVTEAERLLIDSSGWLLSVIVVTVLITVGINAILKRKKPG